MFHDRPLAWQGRVNVSLDLQGDTQGKMLAKLACLEVQLFDYGTIGHLSNKGEPPPNEHWLVSCWLSLANERELPPKN